MLPQIRRHDLRHPSRRLIDVIGLPGVSTYSLGHCCYSNKYRSHSKAPHRTRRNRLRSGCSRFKLGNDFWIVVVVSEDRLLPRFFSGSRRELVLELAVVHDVERWRRPGGKPPPIFS